VPEVQRPGGGINASGGYDTAGLWPAAGSHDFSGGVQDPVSLWTVSGDFATVDTIERISTGLRIAHVGAGVDKTVGFHRSWSDTEVSPIGAMADPVLAVKALAATYTATNLQNISMSLSYIELGGTPRETQYMWIRNAAGTFSFGVGGARNGANFGEAGVNDPVPTTRSWYRMRRTIATLYGDAVFAQAPWTLKSITQATGGATGAIQGGFNISLTITIKAAGTLDMTFERIIASVPALLVSR